MRYACLFLLGLVGLIPFRLSPVSAADIVLDGKSVAVIVTSVKNTPAPKQTKGNRKANVNTAGESLAVQILVDWIRKITDVELKVSDKAPEKGIAIFVGKAALEAGLKLDDIESPTKEGVRIKVENNRIFIAGQSEAATVKAVCRFLEELGCRYFMDGPLGEVYPRTQNLTIRPGTITEKPGLLYRNPKGPTWMGGYWKAWNGAGGEDFAHSHSWGRYIPKGLFEQHPEYFSMGADGKRKDGDWLCTSNPAVRQVFADGVIKTIQAGTKNPSISPPDGRGYCQCPQCKAQDDPKSIEPSSGTVSVTNRYVDFFDDVGKRVAKVCPDSVLSFYCYADYTQPPTTNRKLSPNLCAVIAPIRYCRLHEIGDPNCPSRKQQLEMIDGWAKVASRLGYYNYMYNLADATLPFCKYTPCKSEFPYLVSKGLDFMTIEVLSNWYIYGPQIYFSLRQAYQPQVNVEDLFDDYCTKFYGDQAAQYMKLYWLGIDRETKNLSSHSGGFYGLQAVYTPEFIRKCQGLLKQAAEASKDNPILSQRVAMHAAGFQNVIDYRAICDAMSQGDCLLAKKHYEVMTARIDHLSSQGYANREYGTAYLRRFLLKTIDGGIASTSGKGNVINVLPDQWKMTTDDADQGENQNFHLPTFDDKKWRSVATYSSTLSAQGIGENTILWYRTTFEIPAGQTARKILFLEVDGGVTVYINGKAVEPRAIPTTTTPAKPDSKKPAPAQNTIPRRAPFELQLSELVHTGVNTIVVRVDNRKISELFLGGIIRPVYLISNKSDR